MTRPSRREIKREVDALREASDTSGAVPLVVPSTALPPDHPDRDAAPDGIRETVDGASCEIQFPYHRPRGLFGDAIPLITEPGIARLWRSLPDDVAAAERELREARDKPIPTALGGDADT